MGLTLIQDAVSSLTVASDIAQGFLKLKSISEVHGKVIDLQHGKQIRAHPEPGMYPETRRRSSRPIRRH
ncbi:hypothetical protein [Plasticicumulans lactativorans]|uniref:hypothetical protein n=1 Tax=Plasticicumulans lactativorans TaxID=1133106 RepID=UPI001404CFD3|nr:hypothetical protein [Plasticicumulans lactativorans]